MIQIEPHIKALIFDCDGTLADTIPSHLKAYQDILRSCGLDVPKAFIYKQNGHTDVEIMTIIKEAYKGDYDPVLAARQKDDVLLAKYLDEVEPVKPVLEIMRKYHGHLPMAIATNSYRDRTLRFIRAIDAVGLYDALVSLEDVERGKPNPDLFLKAAELMEVAPEACHVFEDADHGLEAARRAGMSATDIREFYKPDYV